MDPIPQPHLLDPDRLLDPQRDDFVADHESRAEMYATGLRESCGYAQQLWHTLDDLRGYLMASLPPDPRRPGEHVTCAAPTGPDDEVGWTRWIDTFSSVTSVLCGPHGDSGYGYGEARHAAQLRRDVPRGLRPAETVTIRPDDPPAGVVSAPEQADDGTRSKRLRVAIVAVVIALAVRGALPRRRA
jgi:hypothetical protein